MYLQSTIRKYKLLSAGWMLAASLRALDRVRSARRTVKCASWWILPQSPKFFSKTVGIPSLEAPSTSAITPAQRRPRARQRRLDSRLKRKTAPPSSDRSRPSWRYGEHQRGTNARRANEDRTGASRSSCREPRRADAPMIPRLGQALESLFGPSARRGSLQD